MTVSEITRLKQVEGLLQNGDTQMAIHIIQQLLREAPPDMIVFEPSEDNKGLTVLINREPATASQLGTIADVLNFDVRLKEKIEKALQSQTTKENP